MLTACLCLLMLAPLSMADPWSDASAIVQDPGSPFATDMIEGATDPQLDCDVALPTDWFEDLPPQPATQLSLSMLPRLSDSGFGIQNVDVRHSLLAGYNDLPPVTITPGIALQHWSGPIDLDLPSRVFEVYLDFQTLLWENENGSFALGATPGFYGDFELIDDQTFQWTGWALATRPLTSDLTLAAGFAYVRQLQSNWLPMGGLIWTPTDTTRWELVFPRPKATALFYDSGTWAYWGYVAGEFGGGAWSVEDAPQTNVLVAYSDLRLVHGWEAFSIEGHEWRAEIGYVFARDISVNDTSLSSPTDTFLAQVMFAF
ncbi:MAG: hypothetical protein ACO1RT_20895 [Planctomycetaceae bacterium]